MATHQIMRYSEKLPSGTECGLIDTSENFTELAQALPLLFGHKPPSFPL